MFWVLNLYKILSSLFWCYPIRKVGLKVQFYFMITSYPKVIGQLLSAAERRGTPVLLSASVSDNSGNSPQIAAPRRSREIDQSTQRFHVGCDNRCLLGNEYGALHGREFLGRTLMILILTNQPGFGTLSVVKIPPATFILTLNHADVIGDQ